VSETFVLAGDREAGIAAAVRALRAGDLAVLPTDTVYGLAADAFVPGATAKVFALKQRPRSLPLPVLVERPKQAWAMTASVPAGAEALASEFWPGPLTLVLPVAADLEQDLGESRGTVAVRMPANEHALEVIRRAGPLAVTSANITGQPTPATVPLIRVRLGEAVAVYLDAGPAEGERGSTIVDLSGAVPALLREGPVGRDEVERALGGPVRTKPRHA